MKRLLPFFLLLALTGGAHAQALSALPAASVPIGGGEIVPCTQGGVTKKCLASSFGQTQIQTVATTSKTFGSADLNMETRRSNSGVAMTDTFPASTLLHNGDSIIVANIETAVTLTITAGSGTTISGSSTDTIGKSSSVRYVYDGAGTWRKTLNTGNAAVFPNPGSNGIGHYVCTQDTIRNVLDCGGGNTHIDITTNTALSTSGFCRMWRADATSGAQTDTLPATGATDDCIGVRKSDSSANTVQVNFNGGSAAAPPLAKQGDEVWFAYWGGAWVATRWSIQPQTQVFTASGTWTKPPLMKFARVRLKGAGGGGGSGRRGAAGSGRSGGQGGGSGGTSIVTFAAGELSATETVTVGTAGTAGAAQTSDSTDGNAGTAGTASTFGAHLGACGGIAGLGGTAAALGATTSVCGQVGGTTNQVGSATSITAVVGVQSNAGGASAGGGGGGISTGNTDFTGQAAASASNSSATPIASAAGGANGGANNGTAGGSCADSVNCFGGGGGGGGGANAAGAAGNGGAGGVPGGGGGGGGAAVNGSSSGAGAAGARGEADVTAYF